MAQRTTRSKHRLASATAAVSMGMAVLAGCGAEPREGTGSQARPAVTATASPAASPTTAPASPAPGADGVPDVTGLRLSDGEAKLRLAGFLSVRVVDATGQGRTVLEPNNWVVQTQDPRPGTTATPGLVVTLGVVKPTDGLPSVAAVSGVVPNVLCRDLQSAQDALRAAGFYVLTPKDGLGQDRVPVVDRNWIVVGQSAQPGSRPERSTHVELTVVKYGEPTGNSGCKS